MQDLNDLAYFAAVVTHRGFAPAARALKVPKSKLSRRVARLEADLGVRLLERSTRRFRVTDIGRELYSHCETILAEADAAADVVARARAEPAGLVRVSCPTAYPATIMAAILPEFLTAYPLVRIQLVATNHPVDLIEERVDVAFRVRTRLDEDTSLMMRSFGHGTAYLVASPDYVRWHGEPATPGDIPRFATLSHTEEPGPAAWSLSGPEGATVTVRHEPRLAATDFALLDHAACAGMGIAMLPDHVSDASLRAGRLHRVLPEWTGPESTIHMVFTARRGLLPAVRAFIDHAADAVPRALNRCRAIAAAEALRSDEVRPTATN